MNDNRHTQRNMRKEPGVDVVKMLMGDNDRRRFEEGWLKKVRVIGELEPRRLECSLRRKPRIDKQRCATGFYLQAGVAEGRDLHGDHSESTPFDAPRGTRILSTAFSSASDRKNESSYRVI